MIDEKKPLEVGDIVAITGRWEVVVIHKHGYVCEVRLMDKTGRRCTISVNLLERVEEDEDNHG